MGIKKSFSQSCFSGLRPGLTSYTVLLEVTEAQASKSRKLDLSFVTPITKGGKTTWGGQYTYSNGLERLGVQRRALVQWLQQENM